jgi:hypothetical protein
MARVNIRCVVLDGTAPADATLARVPAEQPITWPVGDVGTIDLAVVGEDGAAFDLTDYTLSVVCRRHVADVAPVFAVDAVNDATPHDETPPGTAVATLASADTASMTAGLEYWYDVRMTDTDGSQQVLPASKWFPGPTVARDGEPAEGAPA